MLLGNASRGRIVAREVDAPRGRFARWFGVRRRWPLRGVGLRFPGEAYWAAFVPGAVDVVFLDERARVLRAVASLGPWRAAGPVERAREHVVLEAGTIERAAIREGDQLEFTPLTSERTAAAAR